VFTFILTLQMLTPAILAPRSRAVVNWWIMGSKKRYSRVLAVLGLGSVASAVHAEEAWLRTTAVAAFADVDVTEQAGTAPVAPSSAISEGADLKRAFDSRRSAHRGTARLLPNPYGSNADPHPPLGGAHGADRRVDATLDDDRWSNPYVVARTTYLDERWSNPYVGVQSTQTDDRWSNPYAAPVRR
jgi:hypothetical protein